MNSEQLAWRIRRHVLEMTHKSHGSHIGSALSVTDILAVLYCDIAKFDSNDPHMPDRDRIVLSKGHGGAAMYAVLAECGFFSITELLKHYSDGSYFSGHISHLNIPGVEFSTGSLGHGFPVSVGMAMAAKRDSQAHHVFAICGDGECDEGSVWETALTAAAFHLDNLILTIDFNGLQCLGACEQIIDLEPFEQKWQAFGWNTIVCNGHDHEQLKKAYLSAEKNIGKPTAIIARTVKGKGISFMENQVLWHFRFPHDGEEYDNALSELKSCKPIDISDPYELEVEP